MTSMCGTCSCMICSTSSLFLYSPRTFMDAIVRRALRGGGWEPGCWTGLFDVDGAVGVDGYAACGGGSVVCVLLGLCMLHLVGWESGGAGVEGESGSTGAARCGRSSLGMVRKDARMDDCFFVSGLSVRFLLVRRLMVGGLSWVARSLIGDVAGMKRNVVPFVARFTWRAW
jgi:hypothetical protein